MRMQKKKRGTNIFQMCCSPFFKWVLFSQAWNCAYVHSHPHKDPFPSCQLLLCFSTFHIIMGFFLHFGLLVIRNRQFKGSKILNMLPLSYL